VCRSLAEAHALGVVHRDLKPANIHIEVLGAGERVKVIDFGIAKIAPGSAVDDGMDLTIAGHTIGTSDYMSPEQIVGGRCEATSDIYSLGIVLYEMLTGWRPFAQLTSPAATMTALLTQTPQPPSAFAAVPPALDGVVMRCLERDPEHRFAGVAELAAELDRLTGPVLQIESVDVPLDDAPASYEVHEVAAIRDAETTRLAPIEDRTLDDGAYLPFRYAAAPADPPPPAPPARGSTRDAQPPKFDGFTTLQGVAVPTDPPSRPRLAAATRPSQPPLPALPLPRASPPRPPPSRWRERLIAAAILLTAATLAGLATYLLASSL
jgi:serine/threonine-protein kinase